MRGHADRRALDDAGGPGGGGDGVVDGSGMAVGQAVRAFELFTGVTPDAEAMRADLFDV